MIPTRRPATPDTLIETLDLHVRTHNVLKRSQIDSISALMALSKADLLGLRNLRPENYHEIRQAVIQHGFMDPDRPIGPFK